MSASEERVQLPQQQLACICSVRVRVRVRDWGEGVSVRVRVGRQPLARRAAVGHGAVADRGDN